LIGLLEEITVCPARPAPRIYIARELDGDGLIPRLRLPDYRVEKALGIPVVIAAPNFNDASQERHLAFVISPMLYVAVHHAKHSIVS
jgi:hypothetical protein